MFYCGVAKIDSKQSLEKQEQYTVHVFDLCDDYAEQ